MTSSNSGESVAIAISSSQSEIDVDSFPEPPQNRNKFRNVINLFKRKIALKRNAKSCKSHDATPNKEDYRIAISQDGKFAATFDTANLRIRILKNTDHRPFKKKKTETTPNSNYQNESDEINKTISYFKITDDLDIDKIYDIAFTPPLHESNLAHESEINDDSSIAKNGSGSDVITEEIIKNKESKESISQNDKFAWSFDISNVQCKNNRKYFIFVAVSRVDVDKDMTGSNNDNKCIKIDESDYKKITVRWLPGKSKIYALNDEIKSGTKGTVVYRIRLRMGNEGHALKKNTITYHHFGDVSGICRFVEDLDDDLDSVKINVEQKKQANQKNNKRPLRRFIVLNFYGIYNFECDDDFNFNLNEKFHYPNSIRCELDYWYTKKDCTDRLLSCIYDKYLLVKQYKNDVQSLEVYDLTEMKLKTTAKATDKDKRLRKHRNIFTMSKLQLCFTQGNNSVRLYFLENGLEIASKSFNEIDKIYSLEFFDSDEKLLIIGKSKDISNNKNQLLFIIWDLYETGKVEPIIPDNFLITKQTKDRLAITSGNILQIDVKGNVTSVLKKIENKLKQEDIEWDETPDEKSNGEVDKSHIIHLEKNIYFKSLADENEPWVLDDYEREIYCLYHDDKKYLKLIVGRSTVQIWHRVQIQDDKEKKINNGEPFLEYIWTNGIPVNQERESTRLRVEEFKYAKIQNNNQYNNQDSSTLNDRINDFYLKVYWYERISKEKSEKDNWRKSAKNEEVIIEEEDNEIAVMEDTRKRRNTRMKRKEKVIRWQDVNEKVSAVRHACTALNHLNRRTKFLRDNYNKMHKYEEIVKYIKYIVWKFVEHKPDQFILLDIRHNVMKNLILSDCDNLIKFILFGDKKDRNHIVDEYGSKRKKLTDIRHIPKSISWPGKKYINDKELDNFKRSSLDDDDGTRPENDMELAIYYCKGRELKDTIIVAYLLEYYSRRATVYAGWMDTVSKALPLLFKYNYDDYAKKLFHKECFADQDHFSAQDPFEIIPKKYLVRRNHNIKFRAFKPRIELQSVKFQWYNRILKQIKQIILCTAIFKSPNNDLKFKDKMYKYIEDFDNDLGKSPLALRVVPLPGFTVNNIPVSKPKYNLMKILLNICWLLFIPRWYKVSRNDKNKLLSPFSRVIHYENNDDIYDNPATEAVIDFRWRNARNYFFFLFLRFLIFTSCFVLISWTYLVHNEISERFLIFLKIVIVIFYYLAFYLFITELIQLHHYGPRNYIDIFNILDVFSIVLPATVTTLILNNFQFSNGFGSIESVDNSLMIAISFSIFILWIELISYFRLISIDMALYIYYIIIIFKAVFPFILFLVIVVVAFAHTMFILLRDPDYTILKNSTLSGVATDTLTNEIFNISLQADFNTTDWKDNPFSNFYTAIEASYFWISGDWVQRDNFDSWAVEVFSLLASIFLVIILQNMMIAFMGGVYEKAETKGRQTLLRYRANQIADYEALHHIHFHYNEPEPKYIYYIGQSKNFEEWYDARKGDQDAIYRGFEEKSTFTKHVFKKSDYDDVSIWKYEGIKVIDKQILEAERTKKAFDAHVEELFKKLEDVQENGEVKDQLRKKLAVLRSTLRPYPYLIE